MYETRCEVPETLGSSSQHGIGIELGARGQIIREHRHRALVIAGHRTHRPVGSSNQAVRAKTIERDVKVRMDLFRRPGFPIRLSDETGDFAEYVRTLRQPADTMLPLIFLACPD